MPFPSIRRTAILTMVAVSLAGTTACFGSFNLTRKLWTFNNTVSKNKFAKEVVFLALNIVPVYGAAGFIDAVVVNTVEFWSGKNPVQMTSTIRLDDHTTLQRVAFEKDGVRYMTIKAFEFDKLVSTTTMQRLPGTDELAVKTIFPDGRRVTSVIAQDTEGHAVLVK